jgi:heme/copper-type cytochrome/quinol oxidase subunit 1
VHLLARPPRWGFSLTLGTGTAGVLFLLALLCCGLAFFSFPEGQRFGTNDEAIFWGCGHLLQIVFTTLLLTIWQTLGEQVFDKAPLSFPQWRVVCALLVLSGLPGPVFYSFWSGNDPELRTAFTRLYMIALPLPILVVAGGLVRKLATTKPQWRSPAYLTLLLTFLLFGVGGVFGIFADGFDTRTPGHYHAELIATTIGLMGLFFTVVLPTLCRGGSNGKALLSLFWFLAIGQCIACCGMFLAGSQGVGRKIAGAAQNLDTPAKVIGMSLNHGGAGIASIGGVIFVYLALTRLLARVPKAGEQSGQGE